MVKRDKAILTFLGLLIICIQAGDISQTNKQGIHNKRVYSKQNVKSFCA